MKINLLNKITQSEGFNKHVRKVIEDDTFAAKTLVALNVAKDVFAYSVRFGTTMKNEEIPKKRRPFVASMDLVSGIVTAAAQIAVGFSLANPKIQNKMWEKLSKNCTCKDMNAAKKGFSQVLALVGSTILAERLIVPIIATPLAEQFEKKFFKKEKNFDTYDTLNVTLNEFQNKTKKTRIKS
ncbi:MAG: hypothetical protein E7Z91_04240 [Cyanobacteria bacterium SIG30]|nr:hypothetical protein [Cyanobacteria bacterium SIG30]